MISNKCSHYIPKVFEVYAVRWWMRHYSGATPKRQIGLSNNPEVRRLDLGRLQAANRPSKSTMPTTTTYTNKAGKKCYTGTKYLKSSQPLPQTVTVVFYFRIDRVP